MKNKYSVFSLIKNAFSQHENWQQAWGNPEPKKEYDAIIVGGGGHGLLVVEIQDVTLQSLDQIIYGMLVLVYMITRLNYGKIYLKS